MNHPPSTTRHDPTGRNMNIEQMLPPEAIQKLRARWTTPEGERVRTRLLSDLRAKTEHWPEYLKDLPAVSLRAPYPAVLDDLRGLNLEGEDLQGVELCFVDLSYARLNNCKANKIRLQGSLLNWADLSHSDLHSADLLQVVARNVNFEGCRLNDCMMMSGNYCTSSFKNASLSGSVLNGAKFLEADLTGALFSGVEAHSTQFPDGFEIKPQKG